MFIYDIDTYWNTCKQALNKTDKNETVWHCSHRSELLQVKKS